MQLRLAALAAELRRALGALLPLRLAHRFPGEAVHFLRGRDGGAGSPRRRRRRHLRGPGAWQLPLLLAQNGQRQEEEAGERRRALAPLRPVPRATPPSCSRAPPTFSPPANASRQHLSAGGSWSPLRGGLPEARAGAEGGEEVVDSGRRGRVEGSLKFRQLGRRRRGADAERASRPFSPGRQPAGRHLTGRCQRSPRCLESPPEIEPSRVPFEPPPPPRCSLFCQRRPLISRGGDPPPRSGRAHTRRLLRGGVRAPSPTRPSAVHGEPP